MAPEFSVSQTKKQKTNQNEERSMARSISGNGLITVLEADQIPPYLREVNSKWRRFAGAFEYTGSVAWHDPTRKWIVFWFPRLIPESKGQSVMQQLETLAKWRQCIGLPNHHLSCFGEASLLSSLIMAHFQATKEATPLHRQWAITDTLGSDQYDRIVLGGFKKRLCTSLCPNTGGITFHGVFPLGVEPGH